MRGHPPLTAALSEYQTKLHGRPIGPERSTVTPSGMQSLLVAMELVAEVIGGHMAQPFGPPPEGLR